VAWILKERDDSDCLSIINGLLGDNGGAQLTPAASWVCTGPECD
jgi:hypothetical protein